jgi:hypothetical protein
MNATPGVVDRAAAWSVWGLRFVGMLAAARTLGCLDAAARPFVTVDTKAPPPTFPSLVAIRMHAPARAPQSTSPLVIASVRLAKNVTFGRLPNAGVRVDTCSESGLLLDVHVRELA